MTDPIADMLTRIRNASAVKKHEVVLPYSNIKFKIAQLLSKEGYLGDVAKVEDGQFPELKLELKYNGKNSVIRNIKRVSKPGRRVYSGSQELPVVLNNLGVCIVSTSQGIMTGKDARQKGIGGEVVCEIY
jgi:small subunit ribosomal protein S8